MRRLLSLFVIALPTVALARQPIELSQDEFKMYRHWQKAMNDPRVEKINPDKRNAAIAKDAHFKLGELEKAIARGEEAGDLKVKCEENLKEGLGEYFSGKLGKIIVDTDEPHAVAYVQWLNADLSQLEEEAALAASVSAKECPIVSTITVYAQDSSNPKSRVFQALISRSAAAKISTERARDFADTRYIRLFEGVKNLANGDTFEPEATTGTAGAATRTGGTAAGGQR